MEILQANKKTQASNRFRFFHGLMSSYDRFQFSRSLKGCTWDGRTRKILGNCGNDEYCCFNTIGRLKKTAICETETCIKCFEHGSCICVIKTNYSTRMSH